MLLEVPQILSLSVSCRIPLSHLRGPILEHVEIETLELPILVLELFVVKLVEPAASSSSTSQILELGAEVFEFPGHVEF